MRSSILLPAFTSAVLATSAWPAGSAYICNADAIARGDKGCVSPAVPVPIASAVICNAMAMLRGDKACIQQSATPVAVVPVATPVICNAAAIARGNKACIQQSAIPVAVVPVATPVICNAAAIARGDKACIQPAASVPVASVPIASAVPVATPVICNAAAFARGDAACTLPAGSNPIASAILCNVNGVARTDCTGLPSNFPTLAPTAPYPFCNPSINGGNCTIPVTLRTTRTSTIINPVATPAASLPPIISVPFSSALAITVPPTGGIIPSSIASIFPPIASVVPPVVPEPVQTTPFSVLPVASVVPVPAVVTANGASSNIIGGFVVGVAVVAAFVL